MSAWVSGPGSYGWQITEDGPEGILLAVYEATIVDEPDLTAWLPVQVAHAAIAAAGSHRGEGYDVSWAISSEGVSWCRPLDMQWTACPARMIEGVECIGLPTSDFQPCEDAERAYERIDRATLTEREMSQDAPW